MCGIAGFVSLSDEPMLEAEASLSVMGRLLEHRGPDDASQWVADEARAGMAHRRLSIIDLSPAGRQPMQATNGTVLALNGEIYNYLELREALAGRWDFESLSDTETVLAAYDRDRKPRAQFPYLKVTQNPNDLPTPPATRGNYKSPHSMLIPYHWSPASVGGRPGSSR